MTSELEINEINKPSFMGGDNKKMHPHKFTMWIAIASIIMLFAGLTSAFIVKSNKENWTTVEIPTIFWISTAVLLLSSVTITLALRFFKKNEMSKYRLFLATTALLGVAFLILQWMGFREIWYNQHVTFKGAGAGQFLYVIFGFHLVHVLGGVIALLVMIIKRFIGKVKVYNSVSLELMATYWHFVDFLWVYLLVFFIAIS